MIPWWDDYGRVATFVARSVADDEPRYLFLRGAARPPFFRPRRLRLTKDDPVIIVEGILDALLLSASGTRNVIATGGTSVASCHASWLRERGVSRVVLALDSDDAGQTATMRLLDIIQEQAPEVRAQAIPRDAYAGAKDPADIAQCGSRTAIERLLGARLPSLAWKARRVVGDAGPHSPIGVRHEALDDLVDLVAAAKGPTKEADTEDVVRLAVERLGYTEATVRTTLGVSQAPSSDVPSAAAPPLSPATLALLAAVCEGLIPDDAAPESDEAVWAVAEELGPRLGRVLSLRFGRQGHRHTLEEIGAILDDSRPISRERVRQLQVRALRRLRHRSKRNRILGLAQGDKPARGKRQSDPNAAVQAWVAAPGDGVKRAGAGAGDLADDIVRVLQAVGKPIGTTMLTHVLRASGGQATQSIIAKHDLAWLPARTLPRKDWSSDRDLVAVVCSKDNRIRSISARVADLANQAARNGAPNQGVRWSREEEARVERAWFDGQALEEIALGHGRTEAAVAARLAAVGAIVERDEARRLACATGDERRMATTCHH